MKATLALPFLLITSLALPRPAGAQEDPAELLFRTVSRDRGMVSAEWNESELQALSTGPFRVSGFPLSDGLEVDLDLERFRVTGTGTRFVVGHRNAR